MEKLLTHGLPPDDDVSRRDFLLRAGQLGAALSIGAPAITSLLAEPATARALRDGVIREVPAGYAQQPADVYSGLRWRMLGPFRGGRCAAATGVPGRPHEFYFGSVNGGVWKTIDGGRIWEPVFDSQSVASIGAISVAPSAPDVVYVGSGESTLRDSAGFGNG